MGNLISKLTDIQHHLDALARQHRVPGATLGVMDGDEFVEFATGVVNVNTDVEATPDSLFQIGSNTKLLTGTLVMQLVDEGEVELDAPVRDYLPDFTVDDKAAETITVRHLLTHSSGIQGDHFEDTGRGEDCLNRYMATLSDMKLIHQPGEMFSYCNSGFVVLGLLAEQVTGKPYHQLLRERIFDPLGMRSSTVVADEALARRVAIGHTLAGGGPDVQVAPRPMMAWSNAPAGSLTWSTPRELLFGFIRCHLDGGRAPDGSSVLSSDLVKAMQEPQVKLHQSAGLADAVGLAWLLREWGGQRVIGHGGATIGQLSFLQVLPDSRFGVVLMTNSATGGFLWRDLARYLFGDFAGVTPDEVPKEPAEPARMELEQYAGRYERLGVTYEISVDGDRLAATATMTGPLQPPEGQQLEFTLTPIDREAFHVRMPPTGADAVVSFLSFDRQGRPRYLHSGGRAARRARTAGGKAKASKKKK